MAPWREPGHGGSDRHGVAIGVRGIFVVRRHGSVAHADKRVALVIGNSAYRAVPTLPNPAADARLMSDTLKSLGFFVVGGGAQINL